MQEIDQLILQHKGLVYKQLHKYYLVNDPEAESIAFWSLYTALTTYDTSRNTAISTYATCLIYNALGDYVRKLNRKRKLEVISFNNVNNDGLEYSDVLSDNRSAEDACMQNELVRRTKEAIEDISTKVKSDKQRAIIELFVANDYNISATDMAKQLGVSQCYVSQSISEFKFKLKNKMEEFYNA